MAGADPLEPAGRGNRELCFTSSVYPASVWSDESERRRGNILVINAASTVCQTLPLERSSSNRTSSVMSNEKRTGRRID
ncbi:hypothetical protein BRADI_1g08113v3 [Brachypodium distachyon]|uniref:Uncharacterized protein n=1 Tax=Brachypodium distachyon TaxID=15368 RepID=A0A2K2DIK6_BRADI|nr:hypothetical protein BRADI_1g08113v3 [Brachypodium distachyon]